MGKQLTLFFMSKNADLKGVEVAVHYEIFDGLPVLSKWLSIQNTNANTSTINQVVHEIMAIPEE